MRRALAFAPTWECISRSHPAGLQSTVKPVVQGDTELGAKAKAPVLYLRSLRMDVARAKLQSSPA